MSDHKHLYLVDGSAYIFRAYYSLPPLTNPAGVPVGAVAGYIGAALSAAAPDLPTGAVTVLLVFAIFAASVIAAPRGILARWRHGR